MENYNDTAVQDDSSPPDIVRNLTGVETNITIDSNIAKYEALVTKSQTELDDLTEGIQAAEELVKRAGLSARSGLKDIVDQFREGTATSASIGAHSNTDHIVSITGDYVTDRIAELRRTLLNRCRESIPESREDRWDKQKAPGERRRRITRAKESPPEPPPSAYVIFLSQMTAKMRHDRPKEPHRQPVVMREASKLWTTVLSDDERQYYTEFCQQIQEEYKQQHLEYRATGSYTPSQIFERPDGANLWVRKQPERKNALEQELATYETLIFPTRPPEMDEAYKQREKEGRERRKLKLRMEAAERRRRKNLPPIVPRKRKRKSTTDEEQKNDSGGASEEPSSEQQMEKTSPEQESMEEDFVTSMKMMETNADNNSKFAKEAGTLESNASQDYGEALEAADPSIHAINVTEI